jgi:hypothetical protein
LRAERGREKDGPQAHSRTDQPGIRVARRMEPELMMIFLVPASVAVIRGEIRTVDTHGVRWVDASPLCLVHRTKAVSSTKG